MFNMCEVMLHQDIMSIMFIMTSEIHFEELQNSENLECNTTIKANVGAKCLTFLSRLCLAIAHMAIWYPPASMKIYPATVCVAMLNPTHPKISVV